MLVACRHEGAAVPKEFINPNFHVILIHYPLGLLVVGTIIELFAFLWRRSAFRAAGRWMILIGALSLVPTATSGLYAMADVNRVAESSPGAGDGTPDDATWSEVRAQSPVQGEAWEMMTRHAWSNAAGSVVLLLMVVLWLGSSDIWRSRLHLLFLLLLVGGLGMIIFGAWYGGEMIYRHGVGVEVVRETGGTGTGGGGSAGAAALEQTDIRDKIAYYAPPLQVHVILAGAAVSLGLAALGLSLRSAAQARVIIEPTPELTDIDAALHATKRPLVVNGMSQDDATMRVNVIRRAPAGRFWLLAALIGIAASASGMWTLAHYSSIWEIAPGERAAHLWGMISDRDQNGGSFLTRRLAHMLAGGGLVLLLLVLAVVSRWAAARRMMLTLLTFLLLGAVAAQIWLGSLLMFDTPAGGIGTFNRAAAEMAAPDRPTTAPATTSTAPATQLAP
jgi:uncharacterized membrane protein